MKSRGRLESEVLAGVLAYLAMRGDCFFWRQGNFAGALPGGYMHAAKGVPDILCVKDGRLYGIEVKRELGGKVSGDQERFGQNLEAAGGKYVVTRGVDDAEKALGPIGPRIAKAGPRRTYPR